MSFEQYEDAALDTDEQGIHTMTDGKVAWFCDADGNTFAIEQSLTGDQKGNSMLKASAFLMPFTGDSANFTQPLSRSGADLLVDHGLLDGRGSATSLRSTSAPGCW